MALFRSIEHTFRAATLAFLTLWGAEQAEAQCVPEREAYFAMDAQTGEVLLEQDADTRIQPASMTKLMTLLLAHEAIKEGLMSPDDRIFIANGTLHRDDLERFSHWSGSIRLSDAMRGAAISSYNDMAATIAEFTAKARGIGNTETQFVALMNQRAQELGMTHTVFYNASGLPTPLIRTRDGGTTTRDLAILLKHILDKHPDLVALLGTETARVRGRTLHNTNTLLRNDTIPDEDIFGKTGYTCDAGYALTAHTRRGERQVIASYVGGRNASDREAAFLRILNEAFEKLEHEAPDVPRDTPQGPPEHDPGGGPLIYQTDRREPDVVDGCFSDAPGLPECIR
ncbi:MAG: D-alanyl-D-alanine carboxypeptidase [Alphaproteobacteria bacterium]|nr:D-alanyl-D-alanine carboxypeptidase [Alphaproteobacteria bacterium]